MSRAFVFLSFEQCLSLGQGESSWSLRMTTFCARATESILSSLYARGVFSLAKLWAMMA